jgi:protein phosphatase 1 regulatory subunit 7
LRSLDGVIVTHEEKIKAENLHGLDLNDRKNIFSTLLPEESFVDRRVKVFEEIEPESESDPENIEFIEDSNVHGSRVDLSSAASRFSKKGGSIGSL